MANDNNNTGVATQGSATGSTIVRSLSPQASNSKAALAAEQLVSNGSALDMAEALGKCQKDGSKAASALILGARRIQSSVDGAFIAQARAVALIKAAYDADEKESYDRKTVALGMGVDPTRVSQLATAGSILAVCGWELPKSVDANTFQRIVTKKPSAIKSVVGAEALTTPESRRDELADLVRKFLNPAPVVKAVEGAGPDNAGTDAGSNAGVDPRTEVKIAERTPRASAVEFIAAGKELLAGMNVLRLEGNDGILESVLAMARAILDADVVTELEGTTPVPPVAPKPGPSKK